MYCQQNHYFGQITIDAIPFPRHRRRVDSVCFIRHYPLLLPRYRRFCRRHFLLPPPPRHRLRDLILPPRNSFPFRRCSLLLLLPGTTTIIIVDIVRLFHVLFRAPTTSFCHTLTTTTIPFEILTTSVLLQS